MADHRDDSPLGSTLGPDIAAHVEAIVHAAEREARAAERAIADRRRSAEEEVQRYLAAARLHVDAETAARAARLEALSGAARRLADELSDAASALTTELRRDADLVPRAPWPSAAPAPEPPARPADAFPPAQPHGWPSASDTPPSPYGTPPAPPAPAPEPTWSRAAVGMPADPFAPDAPGGSAEPPNAARLVAIEMAVGGSSRAEVEAHLLDQFGDVDATPLLDDVFGSESHATSRLAWGEP